MVYYLVFCFSDETRDHVSYNAYANRFTKIDSQSVVMGVWIKIKGVTFIIDDYFFRESEFSKCCPGLSCAV